MIWFMAVVILGKGSPLLALRLHFVSCRRGVAGVGVGRIAGGLSAVEGVAFRPLVCLSIVAGLSSLATVG